MQFKNKFAIPKPILGHEEDFAKKQAHKIELSSTADINLLENPYEA